MRCGGNRQLRQHHRSRTSRGRSAVAYAALPVLATAASPLSLAIALLVFGAGIGTIDVAILFTGSSVIKDDYVLLEDDQGLQPADNPMALARKQIVTPELRRLIESVNAELDTAIAMARPIQGAGSP